MYQQQQQQKRSQKQWLIISLIAFMVVECIFTGAIAAFFLLPQATNDTARRTNDRPLVQQEQPRVSSKSDMVAATPHPAPTPRRLGISDTSSITNTLEAQVEAVYQHASPAVVNITNRSLSYDFFLNPVPREGTGSGFFYDDAGNIVTNYHVIEHAEELQVALSDGRSVAATVVGSDPSNDLAVIHVAITPGEVPSIAVDDTSPLRVGQFVVAIGNPFGLERTLTLGVISSLGRVIESPNQRFIGEIIQTDAAINPGNSGGPLLDLAGNVVGVNSAIFSPSGASAGIGFAIPANTVQRVVPALIANGRYPHPSLGVQLYELKRESIELLRLAGMEVPVDSGLLVVDAPQAPHDEHDALHSGSERVHVGNVIVPIGGDIVIAIDNEPVATMRDVIVYLETHTQVGETVAVTVIRNGKEHVVHMPLTEVYQ